MYVGIEGAIKIAITVIILVFIILALLALLMMGLRMIIELTSKKQKKAEKSLVSEKKKVAIEKPEGKNLEQKSNEYSDELVAVITAAIASYMETPMKGVKILNIKRTMPVGTNPWTIAGMQNVMSNRTSINSKKKGGF
jgi:sodium pump decarboxylase gamma subunit